MSVARFKSLLDSEHAVEEIEEGEKVGGQWSVVSSQSPLAKNFDNGRPAADEGQKNPKSQIPNPKSL
jgi:hypothetical protein